MYKINQNTRISLENEIVPAQDPAYMTIEGIPQEVIDELYDYFDDVNYENYMNKSQKKKRHNTYMASFFKVIGEGKFSCVDPKTYKNKTVVGEHRLRYLICGKVIDSKTLDLLSIQEYNCILSTQQQQ